MALRLFFVDDIADATASHPNAFLISSPAQQVAAEWPIDIGAAVWKDDHLLISRTTTVTDLAMLRGQVRLLSPRCATIASARVKNGRFDPDIMVVGMVGGDWTCIEQATFNAKGDRRFRVTHPPASEIKTNMQLALSSSLTVRYNWHVALGFSDDGPRIVLPTSPSGCLSLFRTRDQHPGEKRRTALRHWVTNHYRHTVGEDGLSYVRDHLRGATRFFWNSLDCELMVSKYDLERNELFRSEAAAWRASRKHNRVRLRITPKRGAA